jgi:hypothetical protein
MPTPHDEMVFMLANKAINTTQGWLDKSPRTLVADVTQREGRKFALTRRF